jgi:hypothetical protein
MLIGIWRSEGDGRTATRLHAIVPKAIRGFGKIKSKGLNQNAIEIHDIHVWNRRFRVAVSGGLRQFACAGAAKAAKYHHADDR